MILRKITSSKWVGLYYGGIQDASATVSTACAKWIGLYYGGILAVVYIIRIREPSPKWIGISTVGFWMLQQHRPQKVQNSPKFHHVGSASLFSSSLSSRRCICLFHIVVSEYMPKITYFSSRRCICLFHIVVSECRPKITYFSSCRCISLFHRASPEYMSKFIYFLAGSWIWDPGSNKNL